MPNYRILTPCGASDVTITFPSTSGTLALAGGGGITGFTSQISTAAPNATTNVSQLLVNVTTTNGDLVLEPKGNGAILADIPDNLVAGGNKRGIYAVDFQRDRTNSNQVASGTYAAILSGRNNTASNSWSIVVGGTINNCTGSSAVIVGGDNHQAAGNNSFIGGGNQNTTPSQYATIAGGLTNTASGTYTFIGGGQGNIANQPYSSVVGGATNYVQNNYSFIGGGSGNNVNSGFSGVLAGQSCNIQSGNYNAILGGLSNNIYTTSSYSAILGGQSNQVQNATYAFAYGVQCWANHNHTVAAGNQTQTTKLYQRVWASGRMFSNGDVQQTEEHFYRTTTDATLTTLTANNSALGPNTSLAVPLNGVLTYKIIVSCKRSGHSDIGSWEITGCAYNNAGTVTLYNNTINLIYKSVGSYDVTTAADSTNDTVNINVTGAGGHTILWSSYATTIRSVLA